MCYRLSRGSIVNTMKHWTALTKERNFPQWQRDRQWNYQLLLELISHYEMCPVFCESWSSSVWFLQQRTCLPCCATIKSWTVYLLPVGIASSSKWCRPPEYTGLWPSPARTGVRHRSPRIPDMAQGMHLNVQSIQHCVPVPQNLGNRLWASYLLTPSVFVAEVRKPPHVAQADNISRHGQEKLHLTSPVSSLLQLHLLAFSCAFFIQHGQKLSLNPV